jgi:hypothetical protein
MEQRNRDLWALTGALFVVLVIIAFIPLGGDTPGGDDSAQKVVSFYSDNNGREIIAALVLAIAAGALVFFSAILKGRIEAVFPGRSILPNVVLGGGIVAAGGFLAGAGMHFALADYADDIQPAAAQALNAIDNDFFLPFTTGLAVLLFATSLVAIRGKVLLPAWLAWVGVVLFVLFFTPIGFVAFGLSGIWIIIVSVMLYLRGDTAAAAAGGAAPPG